MIRDENPGILKILEAGSIFVVHQLAWVAERAMGTVQDSQPREATVRVPISQGMQRYPPKDSQHFVVWLGGNEQNQEAI